MCQPTSELFPSVVQMLRERVDKSPNNQRQDPEILDEILKHPSILNPAMVQSIRDMACTAVQGRMDEEARTVSFMGHLASNINWYSLIARWNAELFPTAPEVRPCNLFWAQQDRHVEAWRGADFGIVVRTDCDRVRVCLYQAKRCSSAGTAHLMRRVADTTYANNQIIDNVFTPLNADMMIDPFNDKADMRKLHQIHRLEHYRRKGIELVRNWTSLDVGDVNWCRYVFWHDASFRHEVEHAHHSRAPTERSTKDLFEEVRTKLRKDGHSPFEVNSGNQDFSINICLYDPDHLELSAGNAEKLLGNLVALGLPNFAAIDETGDGSADLDFWQRIFSGSRFNVTHIAGSEFAKTSPRLNPENTHEFLGHPK